jgi:predicted  nucleic acid-binding Zn-ribbon protein
MEKLSQREKLLREERLAIGEIESLQHDIDVYKEDLAKIRKHLADLDNGLNDNAWESYAKELLY